MAASEAAASAASLGNWTAVSSWCFVSSSSSSASSSSFGVFVCFESVVFVGKQRNKRRAAAELRKKNRKNAPKLIRKLKHSIEFHIF